ncbi:MAG: BcpO-related WXXGXW repeat protein [Kofleriaceae bacterium]|nr:BcpO-related WXXGXW repeat protein [Kofleriaceae bacterium]
MMRWGVAAIVVAVGCGGSSKRSSALDRVEAMRPPPPYDVRSVRGYTAATTCGQGPYRIEAAALGARFGEQIAVNICAPRSLQGDYQLTLGTDKHAPEHFGSRNNSDRCKPTDLENAQHAAAGGPSAGPPSAPIHGGLARPLDASSAPLALQPVAGEVAENCPEGTYLTGIVSYYMESTSDGVPWDPGMPLVVDIWSTEPLDLDGAVFVVVQRAAHADMTLETWTAYRDGDERWIKMWNATLAGEVKAGRATYRDTAARAPDAPPPPRAEIKPPSPSTHAEWIPGFWKLDGEWIWSAGFWRVPESDIVAEQTVEAPVAPPPLKVETPPSTPAVSVNLVWTPGYWAWNGSAYIWIEGAWRIPPQVNARWIAPTWSPRRGRLVLVPGGWSIRIGR